MRTIAVIARKGGSGKTTVAVNLAIAAHRRGLTTVLADTDPQRSSMDVLKTRTESGPSVVEVGRRELYALQASSIRDGVDTLIIDTPAGEEDELANSMVLADLSLFIVRPTFVDFASLVRTLSVIRRLRKPALVVLNQAPAARAGVEPPAIRKAHEALRLLKLPVSPAILRSRAAYQLALEKGCSAEEYLDENASGEISHLWSTVYRAAFDLDCAPRRSVSDLFVYDSAFC